MNRSNISLVGNTTTAQNIGGGTGIYKGKVGTNNLQFKSLSGGTGSVLIDNFTNPNVITLYSLSGGSIVNLNNGITGATSLGTGTGVYTSVSDCNIKFKSLSGGTGISISSDANTINICSISLGSITGGTNGLSTSGKNITLGGVLTGDTIFDGTVSNFNLKYGGDYSANFTARSLPDINWITGNTGTITGGTNGLTTSGKSIKLGGKLTENTNIDITSSFTFTICGALGGTSFLEVSDTSNFGGVGHHIQLNSNCETNIWGNKVINIGKSTSPFTQCLNINFNCAAVITDSSSTRQGLTYADDYSAYYTCLSIPHVGWITGHTGGTTGGITGATSLGIGTGVYTNVSDCNLQFKSLSGGTGISISSDANTINICSIGGGGSITGGTNGLSTLDKNIILGGTLTGTTTIILGIGSSLIFTDNRVSPTGIQYDGDYSAGFTERSIPDVGWITGNTGGGFLGIVSQTSVQPINLKNNQWVKPAPNGDCFNYIFDNFYDSGATAINVNLSLEEVYLRYHSSGSFWSKESYNRPITSGHTWVGNSNNNYACEVPVIDEWVSSESGLTYTGQKFAYDSLSILQTDVGVCRMIPNYILIKNINLKTVGNIFAFTIPVGKAALLNRAKLIFLNDATPTCFSVSIGNNYCVTDNLSYNNLANLQQIQDVLTNEIFELDLSTSKVGAPEVCGSVVNFRVGSGSTSANNLCAHLLVESFLY
jgi:hypothetical protein